MNNIKKLFPVIHPISWAQMLNEAELCRNAGADGIFLINQGKAYPNFENLIEDAARIKQLFGLWVGVNILNHDPFFVYPELCKRKIDGYWTDTPESLIVHELVGLAPQGTSFPDYYCSLDFKYQDKKDKTTLKFDIEWADGNRGPHYDLVITTSGPATGVPPDIEKMKWFREILSPDRLLAVASGINLENIESFLPYVDHFLVSSSLEDSYGRFNEERLKKMVGIVESYSREHEGKTNGKDRRSNQIRTTS